MYIDNDDFSVWMQKLYAKLEELCKDVRVLRNADKVLPEDDNLLTRVRDKDCVKNRVKRAKIVRFTLC